MIYFVRYDDGRPVETASCEDVRFAAEIEARGFELKGYAVWDAARAELDAATMERMGWRPQARAVGEPLLKTKWAI